MNHPISVTILTKNAQETLSATLDSVANFSEVIVLDSGSSDETKNIAIRYPNVKWIEKPFIGFGPMHNLASSLASNEWILSIDSDEVLSKELSHEILRLSLEPTQVYLLDRHNYFQGKWMKTCSGWYPDPIIRLYNKNTTQFSECKVHEKVLSGSCKVIPLKAKLIHTPYRSIESLLTKMQFYSTLFAEQNRGKSSSLGKAIWHGMCAFLKSYVLKRGFLGGKEGFIISMYNAHTSYYKYLKLAYPEDETNPPH